MPVKFPASSHSTVLFLTALSLALPLSGGWYNRKAEGWFYFEETKAKEKREKEFPVEELSALDQINKMKKELEEKLAEAILVPSEENLQAYMEAQKQLVAKASMFSHQWSKTLLAYPQLDASLNGRPMSRYGIKLYDMDREEELKRLLNALSKEYLIAFFYEGKSRVSQAQSTIITEYAKKRGFKLLPLTVDHVPLENLPNSQLGNEFYTSVRVPYLPALYLLNPRTEEMIPIGFGLVTMDVLENNIKLQLGEDIDAS